MSLLINAIEEKDIAEVKLQGDIDFCVSPDVQSRLLLACSEDIRQVVVDLSLVTSMDTSGVAVLIEGLRWSKKEGKSFVLKNVGTNVRNTLSLTKLDTAFHIIPDTRNSKIFA